jgi:hypothetical protein
VRAPPSRGRDDLYCAVCEAGAARPLAAGDCRVRPLKHLLTSPIVVTPGTEENGEPSWSYTFTCSWVGAPLDVMGPDGKKPDMMILDPTNGALQNKQFRGAVRRGSKVCPQGDSNTRHAV